MKFCVNGCFTPEWLEDHCRQLNIENRASRCACSVSFRAPARVAPYILDE
jgi:hypothetical protein